MDDIRAGHNGLRRAVDGDLLDGGWGVMDYYNEFDPHAAQWIRNLIARGVIPAGDVDERSSPQRSSPAQWTQCLTAETPTELFSMLSEMSRHAG